MSLFRTKSYVNNLTTQTTDLNNYTNVTRMKFRLICFSINRLLRCEKNKITSRHKMKLSTLLALKRTADGISDNPKETIINLTG